MPSIKISQLNIAKSLSGTDYLVIDNAIATQKTTIDTLVKKVSSTMTVDAIQSAIVSLSSSVIANYISTLVVQSSALSASNWNSTYTTVYNTSAAWNRAYTFISNTEQTVMAEKYYVTGSATQIKGEIKPNNILDIYTAITVSNIPGAIQVTHVVKDASFKTGTIKYIDSVNNIIYVRENNTDTDYKVDENLSVVTPEGGDVASVTALKYEKFNDVLRENHTLKIFNAFITDTNPVDELSTSSVSIARSGNLQTTGYRYKIAQFDYNTGRVSLPSPLVNDDSFHILNGTIEELDNSNFNILNITKSQYYGILIYRYIGPNLTPAPEDYQLVYVLGDSEIGKTTLVTFEDKGLFGINRWASDIKNVIDGNGTGASTGEYKSIYHFPLDIKELNDNTVKYAKGFVTKSIDSFLGKQTLQLRNTELDLQSNGVVDIFIDNSAAYDSVGNLVGGFKAAIRDISNKTLSRIYLSPGVYYTSPFDIEDNTVITGASERNTFIKTLPWNFDSVGNPLQTACLINGSNKKNIDISNITIDGNYNNNISWANFANNFIINNNLGDGVTYQNVNIINTAGGGIYAKKSNNFKIVTSNIQNGGLDITVNEQSTALYAPQSNSFTIHNCKMENWLGDIDLSLSLVGSVTNNIIKNCGYGVLAYGSSSLLLSPNLILGQNNELLPIADLYDTNFDSINLDIDSNYYTSDVILYMREGVPVDLTAVGVTLSSSIETLVELNGFTYTLNIPAFNYSTYGTLSAPSISIISSPGDLANGYVKFKIVSDALASIPTYGQLYQSYYALTTRPTGEKLVGLNYKVKATEYLYIGTTDTKIRPTSYQFLTVGTGSTLVLNFAINNVTPSVLAVGDIIRPVNVNIAELTSFNNLDFKITRINYNSDTLSYTLSAVNTSYTNAYNSPNSIPPVNLPYLGVKNEYIISKGRINKTSTP